MHYQDFDQLDCEFPWNWQLSSEGVNAGETEATKTARGATGLQGGHHKLVLSTATRLVIFDGRSAHLTKIEYRLLSSLHESAGGIIHKDELLKGVWGDIPALGGDLLIRTHMMRLRKKLQSIGVPDDFVQTLRGLGFRVDKAALMQAAS